MLLRAEPTKQKTRRPKWSGITGAVSPKKIGKRKKGMSKLRNVGEKGDRGRGLVRFNACNRHALEVADDEGREHCLRRCDN